MADQSFKSSLALSLTSGLLLVQVFPKFNLPILSAVALAPLLISVVHQPRAWRRFLLGFAAGCVFFGGTCYWIYGVMRNYGGLGIAASAGVFVLFFLTMALYWGIFGWLAGRLWTASWGPPAIPFLWVALEYARAHLLSGFPWLLLGYAGTDYPSLAWLARWTGVYGLSFMIVVLNVALVWIFMRPGKRSGIFLAAVVAVPLILFLAAPPEIYHEDQDAYLVQTNVPESVAFEPWDELSQKSLLERLRTLTIGGVSGAKPSSLIVWPEMPAPFYFEENSFARGYAQDIARRTNSYFLLGIVGYVPGSHQSKPLNSEVLLAPDGSILSQYDKIHLVPFGEYVPLKSWLWFAQKLTAEVSDFVPGDRYVVSQLPGGRMSGVICYEAIFPDLVRRFVKDGAEVLVNTSNDGWYGSSAARYQHLLIARMRAIENARYVLRATNTGITAVIRPDGRISREIAPDAPAVLQAKFAFLHYQTFYTRHGDVFAIAACVLSILALVAKRLGAPASQ